MATLQYSGLEKSMDYTDYTDSRKESRGRIHTVSCAARLR